MRLATAFLFLASLAPGCVGEAPTNNDKGIDENVAEAPRFPRLTNAQWHATVADLLYLDAPPTLESELQADPPLGRFDNNIQRLIFSAVHWRSFQRAAEEVAEMASTSEGIRTAISPSDMPSDLQDAGRAFIEHFGPRVFRREMRVEEVERYLLVFVEGVDHYPEMSTIHAGIRVTMEALLQSPHFLYRVEDSTSDHIAVSLSGHEIASRLSYAFWNTMPSDELLAAATSGDLDSRDGVRDWANTMFDDKRTEAQFDNFHLQAFQMNEYADLDKDPTLFPDWNREVGEAMQTETLMFLGNEVFGGGGVRELLVSTHAFVNSDLAALYGVEGSFGDEFVPVELDPTQRSGLLTRLGFLTKNATLTQSDPIHRGVFVNLNLICRPFPEVPNLPDSFDPTGDTNREQVDSITGPGTCGGTCHTEIINPIGFGLEHYDALGQYRADEGGQPVNASDVYVFESGQEIAFENGLELSEKLASSAEVHACYIQQLLEYLLGRDLLPADMELVASWAQESVTDGLSIREIILRVVESSNFRYRASKGEMQ